MKSIPDFKIEGYRIGVDFPTFFIAEMSGNHKHEYDRAVELIKTAKRAGANAVKMQTYTADTITIKCDNEHFRIKDGVWTGRTLHDLYQEAHTPWEWQPKLKRLGDELGIEVFSTPFDPTAVDFLEKEVGVNLYKIASFEVVDIPLLEKVAATGKPVIMSTGMASLAEIDLAVRTLREHGCPDVALLRCVSAYPASPDQMNLATIPHLAQAFDCVSGLSDHSLSPAVAISAVTLGARIIEKHFALSRNDGGPDSIFSLEPNELEQTIQLIRETEVAIGRVSYGAGLAEQGNVAFRKSLFVVKDVKKGEIFTEDNVRVIRPGMGLSPKSRAQILGRCASLDIRRGSPLTWAMIG